MYKNIQLFYICIYNFEAVSILHKKKKKEKANFIQALKINFSFSAHCHIGIYARAK